MAEQSNEELILIFLDWEKAFDKIDHEKMFVALSRLKIPEKIIRIIKALYHNPVYRINTDGNETDWFKQRTGIRQGCPLSPYLFILTMHTMMFDVNTKMRDQLCLNNFQMLNFRELLYADDTLLIAKNSRQANKLLRLIEDESDYLHLRLNKSKCVCIKHNCRGTIKFKDGTTLNEDETTKYLGAKISKTVDPKLELKSRIANTMTVLRKLDIFWNKTNCSTYWKIIVFNAVIISKLLYGLETIEPTEHVANMLNTFQLKGLRKILKLKTTFIDRNNTNEFVYNLANERIQSPTEGPDRKIKPLTEVLQYRKLKLLGHVMRRDRSHPMSQITQMNAAGKIRTIDKKRKGRPRLNWLEENLRRAWEIIIDEDNNDNHFVTDAIRDETFNVENQDIIKIIKQTAQARLKPFDSNV